MSICIDFFYFMKNDPDKIREVVPAHIAYWKNNNFEKYIGGPFADRSGGLISFEAMGLADATAIIEKDPFIVHGLIAEKWIKEWMPEK
ncbi:MAG: hypothetical protein COW32_05875 [Candidatus Aquicultor secundus]|uniref:YCII-related domain-containing protein n=2 Tax=Candidatus Aquicultor secundus TaxID=1973895 RepID=A0A2M7T854_9ACTN|nr:YciI family protein [Candidatus Aquicultor secundus]NCO65662.1 hypothetical protein [Solirubrobacter sp.]OIO61083.1 MAG: hypothetical protein AUJ82_00045 [Verrucomicrobia bacterium CG1_02_43_26]OIO85954.1 MAG: hypothetical protein AUK32_06280 [Candidatus Aquicultor secundus]PIU27497.1 MAG: hypothetical protein COT10_03250 [Candidatus Aquicultor secundus]PIW22182.1 MAG: hypothetical protein COW32_05875 [Candidatus Aquicultor secundus]